MVPYFKSRKKKNYNFMEYCSQGPIDITQDIHTFVVKPYIMWLITNVDEESSS